MASARNAQGTRRVQVRQLSCARVLPPAPPTSTPPYTSARPARQAIQPQHRLAGQQLLPSVRLCCARLTTSGSTPCQTHTHALSALPGTAAAARTSMSLPRPPSRSQTRVCPYCARRTDTSTTMPVPARAVPMRAPSALATSSPLRVSGTTRLAISATESSAQRTISSRTRITTNAQSALRKNPLLPIHHKT